VPASRTTAPQPSWTVDDLARRADLPVRTIREYQTMGLLPPPEKRGRVGIYQPTHLARLALIARLQDRGYSLAGIRDLLASWRDGADLSDVLGLGPDELVHIDEPGRPATAGQLARMLPDLVPARLDDMISIGVVEACGPDRYCIPSPSLLQLTADLLVTGYGAERTLELLRVIANATDSIAAAATALFTGPPTGIDTDRLVALATRGRGLLAHGTGRLTIYAVGRRLGIDDERSVPDVLSSGTEHRAQVHVGSC
jgi:DNA-binding transcriptional MerR regulator